MTNNKNNKTSQKEYIEKVDKTEITYSDYLELNENRSEEMTEEEYQLFILQQFHCEELYEKVINKNICPECGRELTNEPIGNDTYELGDMKVTKKVYNGYCTSCDILYNI